MNGPTGILNGRYELRHRAGSGGMATVYRAQDLLLGRVVAVKMLHPALTDDVAFLRRFQREAHAAANLNHPNIVTVHDIGQDGNRFYIVMEFVDGQTLKAIVRAETEPGVRGLPLERALHLIIQVCAGVGYAHRANFVHCDVKPHNIIVTADDQVKVADFGIARALSSSSLHDDSIVWGTPQYLSPEQASGQPLTAASDVYSIGVILFELLTGRLPFEDPEPAVLMLKHVNEIPPLVSQFNPAIPDQLEQIVAKVLSKEPAGRYRTAEQLGRVLSAYQRSSKAVTGPFSVTAPVHERPTQAHLEASWREDVAATAFSSPAASTARNQPLDVRPADFKIPAPAEPGRTDWLAVALGLLALVAILGLIPLWYAVYMRFTG